MRRARHERTAPTLERTSVANPSTPAPPRALVIDTLGSTPDLRAMLKESGLTPRPFDLRRPATDRDLRETDVAVVSVDWSRLEGCTGKLVELIDTFARAHIATLVVGVPDEVALESSPLIDRVSGAPTAHDIESRLKTFARFAPMIRRLDRELHHLQRLGRRLNHHFADIDQEMRLAGRLQRDFLPRAAPSVPPLTFEALFRPATWVSGDTYDIFRIDERHVGVLLADAVGHGMAAALLTMFLRQALQCKRIEGKSYSVGSAADVVSGLHRSLVQQALPNCWFITASYLVINTATLELQHARGGAPFALYAPFKGELRELTAPGMLLGLPDVPDAFGQDQVALNPGDKVILYSDGVEDAIIAARGPNEVRFRPEVREWVRMPARKMIQALGDHLDRKEGSLNPADDATVVVVEVAGT